MQYKYRGQAASGQAVDGVLAANSPEVAASVLMSRGIVPLRIEPVPLSVSSLKTARALLGAERVKSVDLIMFCRQMYTVTRAGIPLTRGLRGLSAGLRHAHFRAVLDQVVDRLESGLSFAVALRSFPKIFNHLFVSMIAVGESSGRLDETFKHISFYIERDEETKKRIKAALRYPSFVMIALLVAMAVINLMVIPAFAQMFARFNAPLPWITQVLISVSDLFVNYWHLLLLLLLLLSSAFFYAIQTPAGAMVWGRYKLKLPIVGNLLERASMARYTRSLSLMLGAGVPITQALTLCAATIDNHYLEKKINDIRQGIEHGESLIRTHQQAAMFTPLVLQMIAVGEESGEVETLLHEVSEFYEREVEYDLKTLTDRIEPLLIIVMAFFVGVLGLGIFLPMWSMYDIQR